MTPSEDAARWKSEQEPVSISHSKGDSPKPSARETLRRGLEGESCRAQGSVSSSVCWNHGEMVQSGVEDPEKAVFKC